MMLGFIPITFRFRGKLKRLLRMYDCFLEHPQTGLHPTQIARFSGLPFAEVNNRLQQTPELFVKLPGRGDGITRYRLTSAMTARDPEDVEAYLIAQARRESLLLYAVGGMVLLLLLIVVILIGPAL
ncbi:MAG: hypothetical protein RIB46_00155 [Pseudomonadales bacterium]